MNNAYIKVTGSTCLHVCLCLPKDLAEQIWFSFTVYLLIGPFLFKTKIESELPPLPNLIAYRGVATSLKYKVY